MTIMAGTGTSTSTVTSMTMITRRDMNTPTGMLTG